MQELGQTWIESSVISFWDTWCSSFEWSLLQEVTVPIIGVAIGGANPIVNLRLVYFIPYESFSFLELLYHMVLRMNQQGYKVDAYKKHFVVDPT